MMEISLDTPVTCPVVIGRATELNGLHALLERAKGGTGQILVLSGEAGIGKSRLVTETKATATAQGFQVLQGSCFPTDRSCPYAPFLDLLRFCFATHSVVTLLSELGPRARALFPLLPEQVQLHPDLAALPPLPALDPEQEKRRLFAALANVLTTQAVQQPMLLVVEDLHWSDDLSLEFLHFFARHCAPHPLLLLLTYRSDEMHPALSQLLAELDRERLAREYVLVRLSKPEVEAMLQAIFARQHMIQGGLLETLYALTEGNPFFIEEVLKSLLAAGDLVAAQSTWRYTPGSGLRIPRNVQDAVQRRTATLSEQARQVLVLAAVAGRRFDFAVLQQVTPFDEEQLVLYIKELLAAQLVVEESEEQFAFRHALTRQAIYSGLLARERRALHRIIAETVERLYAEALDTHSADLAYHFAEAGIWTKVLEYALRAGKQASVLYAPRAAIEQFSRALQAAAHLNAPTTRLYSLRGQAFETLGDFEQARADHEHALQAAQAIGDGEMEWQSLLNLGFLWTERDYQRTGTYFQQALILAEHLGDQTMRAHSFNRLGNWLVNTGRASEALETHHEALALFEAQQDRPGMAETLDLLGMASIMYDHPVESFLCYDKAINLFHTLRDEKSLSSSLTVRGVAGSSAYSETAFTLARTPENCVRDLEEALRLARQVEWVAGEVFTEIFYGLVLGYFGRLSEALAHTLRGRAIATEIDHQQWVAGGQVLLGMISCLMLHPGRALHYLEAGLPLARQLGSAWWVGLNIAVQAQAYLLQGEYERAEAMLQSVMPRTKSPSGRPERRILWMWGELALAQGKAGEALQIVEQLLQSAPQVPGITEGQPIPWLLKCKGEALIALSRLEEGIAVLKEAQQGALLRYETPLQWQLQRALGRAYQLLQREDEAQQAYAEARTTIASLAETIDGLELREHFAQAALATLPKDKPVSPRQAAAQQFGGLTERERAVAALIAQGKSNREIAEVLVVHFRTVETHVSNILSKLGFTSRAQIAVWAREKGLGK